MLAFGGQLCDQRSRGMTGLRRSLRLISIGALALTLPSVAAPGVIGLGWLLSLTAAAGVGWDMFALGCGLLGRSLLGTPVTPGRVALCTLAWLLGGLVRRSRRPVATLGGRRLRWEFAAALSAIAPATSGDAWRFRAADALRRALSLTRSLGPDIGPRQTTDMLCLGVAALGHGDSGTARDQFAAARELVRTAAGTVPYGREHLWLWLELIDWCNIAATLIEQEAPQ